MSSVLFNVACVWSVSWLEAETEASADCPVAFRRGVGGVESDELRGFPEGPFGFC